MKNFNWNYLFVGLLIAGFVMGMITYITPAIPTIFFFLGVFMIVAGVLAMILTSALLTNQDK